MARRGGLAHLTPAQQAGISAAYRTALTGCFLLSGAVMTTAFILVLGLPERTLRSEIEDDVLKQATGRSVQRWGQPSNRTYCNSSTVFASTICPAETIPQA